MRFCNIIAAAAFMAALGLVGSIEHGASLALVFPALACIGIFGACVLWDEHLAR